MAAKKPRQSGYRRFGSGARMVGSKNAKVAAELRKQESANRDALNVEVRHLENQIQALSSQTLTAAERRSAMDSLIRRYLYSTGLTKKAMTDSAARALEREMRNYARIDFKKSTPGRLIRRASRPVAIATRGRKIWISANRGAAVDQHKRTEKAKRAQESAARRTRKPKTQ